MPARDAKRWTRDTSSDQIEPGKVLSAQVANILLDHVPMRSVRAKRSAKLRLVFDGGGVMKAGHFQPEGLTAPTGA